jgi:hypothetical protein
LFLLQHLVVLEIHSSGNGPADPLETDTSPTTPPQRHHNATNVASRPEMPMILSRTLFALAACLTFGLVPSACASDSQLARYPDDPATAARIASYELAFQMQASVPEVMDFSSETEETKKLYGLDLPHCKEVAGQLLAARRLVERGVQRDATIIPMPFRSGWPEAESKVEWCMA